MRIVTLTGNKFQKLPQNWLEGQDLNWLIHTSIFELVLIDMGLDWGQIDILAPCFPYVEHLHLVRNQCSQIFSKYQLPKEHFKLLKFVNLEENGIVDWAEVDEFRKLPNLKRLTLNKNHLSAVKYRQGWPELYQLSLEDNAIADWAPIDELNNFVGIKQLRLGGNPILQTGGDRAREIVIARVQYLHTLNGTRFEASERRDCELFYMK